MNRWGKKTQKMPENLTSRVEEQTQLSQNSNYIKTPTGVIFKTLT